MLDAKPFRNLLRRPPQPELLLNQPPQLRSSLKPHRPGPASPNSGPVMSPERPIPAPATISFDLPPHSRPVPTQPLCNHRIGFAAFDTGTDLFPLIPSQHPRTRPVTSNMTHPAMLADQRIHRAGPQPAQLSSLPNRCSPSQRQQRLPRYQPRSPRTAHNPPPGSHPSRTPPEAAAISGQYGRRKRER